jgi:hypothetical protein
MYNTKNISVYLSSLKFIYFIKAATAIARFSVPHMLYIKYYDQCHAVLLLFNMLAPYSIVLLYIFQQFLFLLLRVPTCVLSYIKF